MTARKPTYSQRLHPTELSIRALSIGFALKLTASNEVAGGDESPSHNKCGAKQSYKSIATENDGP